MTHVCLLPGDGIGPEVIGEAERLLQAPALGLASPLTLTRAPVGFGAYQEHGDPLPPQTLEAVADADACLLGAVTTPPDVPNYRSPVLRLRQEGGLWANLRPVASLPHPSSRPGIDMLIVREKMSGATPSEQSFEAALDELYGRGFDYRKAYAKRIGAVTSEDLQRVVKRFFHDPSVVVTAPKGNDAGAR